MYYEVKTTQEWCALLNNQGKRFGLENATAASTASQNDNYYQKLSR